MTGGICLRCDQCGKTLGWQEVFSELDRAWDVHGFTDAARTLGWTGPMERGSKTDRCPECSGLPVIPCCVTPNTPHAVGMGGQCWRCGHTFTLLRMAPESEP